MPRSKPAPPKLFSHEQLEIQRKTIRDGYFEDIEAHRHPTAPTPDPNKETTILRDIHRVLVGILVEMTLANDCRFRDDDPGASPF